MKAILQVRQINLALSWNPSAQVAIIRFSTACLVSNATILSVDPLKKLETLLCGADDLDPVLSEQEVQAAEKTQVWSSFQPWRRADKQYIELERKRLQHRD